jgi:peptide deformylase
LVDIACGQAQLLVAEQRFATLRKDMLTEVIQLTESTIKQTSAEVRQQTNSISQEVMDMLDQLESMLFSLGLDEDQEAKLMRLAHTTSDRLRQKSQSLEAIDEALGKVLEALYDYQGRH